MALDGDHFCSIKACWKRKKTEWLARELERMSSELGIPIYDKDRDGRDFKPLVSYKDGHKELFDSRNEHLRLRVSYGEYTQNAFTDSPGIQVITVSPDVRIARQAEREQKKKDEEEWQKRNSQWEIDHEYRQAAISFIKKIAGPIFANELESLRFPVLKSLLDWILRSDKTDFPGDRKKLAYEIRKRLMTTWLIEGHLGILKQGPVGVAKHLAGVATTWGLQLPENWIETAFQFELQSREEQQHD